MSDPDDDLLKPADPQVEELQRTIRSLNQRLTKATARTDEIVGAIERAFHDAITARPPIKAPPRDRRTRTRNETALWHTTDWQLGKVTESYSTEIGVERVGLFADKAIELTEIQRAHHPVRDCLIAFGGDLLENTNTFPGQVYEIDSPRHAPITHQLAAVVDAGESICRKALAVYEKVTAVFEPGNHGRIGRPGEFNRFDNFDAIAGAQIAYRLRAEPRFTYVTAYSWFQKIEIGNYRAMLIHGDEVKGFGGNIPMYALTRKGNAWKSGAAGWAMRPEHGAFDDIYVGHFHNENEATLAAGGKIYMTGSTESDNPYAAEFVAASAQPSQRLHFVDPDKGRVTSRHQIYV